jgi:hypothetical protein
LLDGSGRQKPTNRSAYNYAESFHGFFSSEVELVRRTNILRAGAERLFRVRAVLVEQRIDSTSLNPDTVITTAMAILETDKRQTKPRKK